MIALSRKWTGLALTASLALNLFLAGTLLGGWLNDRTEGVPPTALQSAPGPSVAEFIGTLPPDGWLAVERALEARRGDVNARIAELRRARDRVSQALVRQPLDPEAVDAAFAELRRRSQAVQSSMHGAVMDMARGMTARDRAYMARGLFLFSVPDNGDRTTALHRVPLM